MPADQSPAYERVKSTLRREIARGDYSPGEAFITQRQLCDRFDVSSTTAVRALSDLVGDGLLVRRRGVGTFVADRPPQPTGSSQNDRLVACILHGLQGSYVPELLSGVESVCGELDYRLLLTDTVGDPDREDKALRQAQESAVAGVVLYPVQGRYHAATVEELRRRGIPLVMVDRYRPDIVTDAVIVDNSAVGYRLTEGLIQLGHRRIATLWSETDCTAVHDRLDGHIRALRDHELPVLPEFTVLQIYWPMADERRHRILRQLLDRPEPPTAFLCANGYVAASAAHDLASMGIDVPDDVELAGMDDAGPYNLLPLTAISASLPAKDLGQQAMRLLDKRIASDDPYGATERLILPIEIKSRQSSAAHLHVRTTTALSDRTH